MTEFFRFPRTPHLAWLGQRPPRKDKVLSIDEARKFLSHTLVVEEKLDGANLGITIDEDGELQVQSRGTILRRGSKGQFETLWLWLSQHDLMLKHVLSPHLILFGEWCYAKHSVLYDRLQDWFYAFDIYGFNDRRFWSTVRRNELAGSAQIQVVPEISRGCFSLKQLSSLTLQQSQLGESSAEGIYLRVENTKHTLARGKLINPRFADSIGTHWSKKRLERNVVLRV